VRSLPSQTKSRILALLTAIVVGAVTFILLAPHSCTAQLRGGDAGSPYQRCTTRLGWRVDVPRTYGAVIRTTVGARIKPDTLRAQLSALILGLLAGAVMLWLSQRSAIHTT
jgi:hypothetical protein